MLWRLSLVALALWFGLGSCARQVVPDPRVAAQKYADAVIRNDVELLYSLLDESSRQALSKPEVEQLMAQSRVELQRRAVLLGKADVVVTTEAEVRYPDGEVAAVKLEHGEFWVKAAAGFPAGASTPAQALAELRGVLSRRSYAGLIRVLSEDSRAALERRVKSLVESLQDPDALDIAVEGDNAMVEGPNGHRIELRQEDGEWKVHDFE